MIKKQSLSLILTLLAPVTGASLCMASDKVSQVAIDSKEVESESFQRAQRVLESMGMHRLGKTNFFDMLESDEKERFPGNPFNFEVAANGSVRAHVPITRGVEYDTVLLFVDRDIYGGDVLLVQPRYPSDLLSVSRLEDDECGQVRANYHFSEFSDEAPLPSSYDPGVSAAAHLLKQGFSLSAPGVFCANKDGKGMSVLCEENGNLASVLYPAAIFTSELQLIDGHVTEISGRKTSWTMRFGANDKVTKAFTISSNGDGVTFSG